MSYFGSKLRTALDDNDVTHEVASKAAGVSIAAVGHVCTGRIKSPSRELVEKLLKVFRRTEVKVELAIAHIEDECPSSVRNLIVIKPKDELELRETPAPYVVQRLDSDVETALGRLRSEIPSNESLRLALIYLAEAVCE